MNTILRTLATVSVRLQGRHVLVHEMNIARGKIFGKEFPDVFDANSIFAIYEVFRVVDGIPELEVCNADAHEGIWMGKTMQWRKARVGLGGPQPKCVEQRRSDGRTGVLIV